MKKIFFADLSAHEYAVQAEPLASISKRCLGGCHGWQLGEELHRAVRLLFGLFFVLFSSFSSMRLMSRYPTGSTLGAKKKLSFSMEEDFKVKIFEATNV